MLVQLPVFESARLKLNSTIHGPDRTRTDPTEFRRKKVRAGPCGSGRVRVRVRVVEFSY